MEYMNANDTKLSRARLLRLFAFVIIVVVGVIFCSYLFRPIFIGNNLSRSNVCGFYAEPRDTLDVVYIGGSNTFTYWAPLEAYHSNGIASFLFSVNSMPCDVMPYYITEAEKTQKPKLYILEVKAFSTRGEEDYVDGKLFQNSPFSFNYSLNRFRMIQNGAPKEDRLYYHFDLGRFHSRWNGELTAESFLFACNRVHNALKGYWFLDKQDTNKPSPADCSGVSECTPISQVAQEHLHALLETCKAVDREVDFLFIASPHTDLDPQWQAKYNYIGSMVNEYGYTFLNLNNAYEDMDLDATADFANAGHTNIIGAMKYTNYLTEYLASHYQLPDHREDPRYASWDQDYQGWVIACEESKEKILHGGE